jgi:hypothetical protein
VLLLGSVLATIGFQYFTVRVTIILGVLISAVAIFFLLSSEFLIYFKAYLFAENPSKSIPIPLRAVTGFMGPVPNLSWEGLDHASWLRAAGLIERNLLLVPVVVGIFATFIEKRGPRVAVFAMFALLSILSLMWAEQTLKARYAIPFLPAVYVLAALGLQHFSRRRWWLVLAQACVCLPLFIIWNGFLR